MTSGTKTLNHILDQAASAFPEQEVFVSHSYSWTYDYFRRQSIQAAKAFRKAGIRQGDRVAICLRNSPEFVAAYFGLARLGAVAVPINFMIQKAAELQYMLQDCEAAGIVAQKDFLPGLLKAKKDLPNLRSVWSTDSEDPAEGVESFSAALEQAGNSSEEDPSVELTGGETATILYTSGTTGNPKGVMLSHANLVSNCESSIQFFQLTQNDVILCLLPMFHTFAWTVCVLISIRLGSKLVIISSITPPKPWLELMARHGVTLFIAIPPIYAILSREAHGLAGFAMRYWYFRKVRLCVSGAAPLNVDVMASFEKSFGLPILEGYGLTETSPVVSTNPPSKPRPGSVGLPLQGVEVKVIGEDEQALPSGENGEICVRGPNVMLGYFHRPQDTRDAFTQDGWFKTGDLGSLDPEGYLSIRGRKKDMIIIKGLKVFSAQVEHVIAGNPMVEEVAVIGIPDAAGDEIIKAFVVLKKEIPANKESKTALLQFCRQNLDAYKRPRDIEFLESLPKNSLQKVLKRVLRERELGKK